jgi:ubiquinone biosynthesis protein
MKVISTATTIGQAFKNAGRVTEILTVFGSHGFADLLQRMKLTRFLPNKISENSRYQHLPPQQRLRLAFEQLGPTFVKLGQLLATRPDLIPESFVEEFEKLQDKVTTVGFPEIRAQIESELGRPLDAIFSSFEESPLAAASIAQVHGAELKDGTKVAVKVQRPGIERLITNDISILRGLAILMERYIPETRVLNPMGLVEEFFRTILFELDFLVENNNIRRVRKNFSANSKIAIPQVHSAFSTGRILVLERFEGIRFTDREAMIARGINPTEIVEAGVDAFFHMVMQDGVFHGDLHAGNLFVLNDGRIGIIDFGIVGRLSHRVQDAIIIMFTALIDEDFETLASEYLNLCQTTGSSDVNLLQKDLMDNISPYIGMALGEVNVGRILLRSTSVATKHNLQVPRELMLLFRAILTIEALGKKLDPTFDMLQVGTRLARQTLAIRYSKERVLRDFALIGRDVQGLVEVTPRLLKRYLRHWSQNDFAIETRSRDVQELGKGLRQFNYYFVRGIFSLGFFALALVLIAQDRSPQFLGFSVGGMLALAIASVPLLHSFWVLRKYAK